MRRNLGFTLLELMITIGILAVVGALTFAALQSSAASVAVAQANGDVQSSVRDVIQALTRELQVASNRRDVSLNPPLQPVAVTLNPAANSPVEVVFQTPADGTGTRWSTPIRFRYVNEDVNGNSRLDAGEDVNGDGVLSRRILRIQDRNGDGDTDEQGEVVQVGGANDLSNVQFVLNGDTLTITATATKLMANQLRNPVSATVTMRVYFTN